MKTRKKTVLDYRVILRSDIRTGSKKSCYVAFCPTLGVADDGDTPQEALKNIQGTISFHLESLQKEPLPNTVYLARSCHRSTHICFQKLN